MKESSCLYQCFCAVSQNTQATVAMATKQEFPPLVLEGYKCQGNRLLAVTRTPLVQLHPTGRTDGRSWPVLIQDSANHRHLIQKYCPTQTINNCVLGGVDGFFPQGNNSLITTKMHVLQCQYRMYYISRVCSLVFSTVQYVCS